MIPCSFKLSSGAYQVFEFPSGEVQVHLSQLPSDPFVIIKGSVFSSDGLMELLQLVEALRAYSEAKLHLVMPYCAYSRQDRRCNHGESFSLKVFTNLINSCKFTSVLTYDPHSDVCVALLNNCRILTLSTIIEQTTSNFCNYDYIVAPDAGAIKKTQTLCTSLNVSMLRADKLRDLHTGQITNTVVYAPSDGALKSASVLIVDDICQGGRTFEELAKAIREIEPTCTIDLYVTHGFFNNGLTKLKDAGIDRFYTTDSVCSISHPSLTVFAI